MTAAVERVGFVGLGKMGGPMAANLVRAGHPLVVWNRSPDAVGPLVALGAEAATDVAQVFARARTVFVMLVDERVTDAVLQRGTPAFAELVRDRVVICTGTTSPEYSRALALDVRAAGGELVEAPVSGSQVPAQTGRLVGLLAGDPQVVAAVRPLFAPLCSSTIVCGDHGSGLLMKLAVNLYLATMLAGLAEAVHFAERVGLDTAAFAEALGAGPMASDVTRVKVPKLVDREFSPQAAVSDAWKNTRLIAEAAAAVGAATPVLDTAERLYGAATAAGFGDADMMAVITAIEAAQRPGGTHDAPPEP